MATASTSIPEGFFKAGCIHHSDQITCLGVTFHWDEADYQVSEITSEVTDNGAVIGYWGDGDAWIALPSLGIDFLYRTGFIVMQIDRIGNNSLVDFLHGTYFRFVIIYPPSTEMIKDVDIEDYQAVMEMLELF